MKSLLSQNRDFRALFASTSVSHFGTMLGALTLTTLLYLDATPAQMGVLAASITAPALLVGILAGVWVDRLPRRALMIWADVGRFLLLLTIPAAALGDELTIEQLYVVAFGAGCLEVLFSLAYRSILPSLVPAERLVDANAGLRTSESVAESVSPTIGGAIVQTFGGPLAVFFDALTFLASGAMLSRLRVSPKAEPEQGRSALREAVAGARTVVHEPTLRAILGMSCTYGFFGAFLITLFAVRVVRELELSPVALGLIAGAGGIGSLAGAGLTAPLARRLGLGPCMLVAYLLATACELTLPLAGGPRWLAFAVLFGGMLLGDLFYVIENVTSLTLRQTMTPAAQMGRVNATFLVANQALRPLGAVVAGVMAQVIGVQETLVIGAVGVIGASVWLIFSPVPGIKTAPVRLAGDG